MRPRRRIDPRRYNIGRWLRRTIATEPRPSASASSGSRATASCTPSSRGRARASWRRGPAHPLAARLVAFFAGADDEFADVELELERRLLRRLRPRPTDDPARGGRHLRRARGARGRAGRRARGRQLLRTQPALAVRPLPPRRRRRRDRLLRRPRGRLQTPTARPRRCRSLTSSATSSRRSRRGGAAAGSPSSRGSATPRASGTCAAAASSTIQLDLSSPAAARRAFTLLRELGGALRAAHLPPRRARPRRPLPAPRRCRLGLRRLFREAGVLSARLAPLRAAAQARRRPLLLPRLLPARSPARGRERLGPARSPPRAPLGEPRRERSCWRRWRGVVASSCGSPNGARHAIAYAKSGEAIADLLALAGAGEQRRFGSTSTRSSPPRARRQTGSPTPTRPTRRRTVMPPSASSSRSGASTSTGCRERSREIARLRLRHPALSLGELAGRCRPPITKAAAHHRMAVLQRIAEADDRG